MTFRFTMLVLSLSIALAWGCKGGSTAEAGGEPTAGGEAGGGENTGDEGESRDAG